MVTDREAAAGTRRSTGTTGRRRQVRTSGAKACSHHSKPKFISGNYFALISLLDFVSMNGSLIGKSYLIAEYIDIFEFL